MNDDKWGRQRWVTQGPGKRMGGGGSSESGSHLWTLPFASPRGCMHPHPNRCSKQVTTQEVPVTAWREEFVEVVVPAMKE